MSYRERALPNLPGVTIWRFEPEGQTPHLVLPDGCIDLLFPEGGRPFVVGAMERAESAHTGVRVTGVRMAAGVAAGLLKTDWSSLTDRHVNVSDLGLKIADPKTLIARLNAPDRVVVHAAKLLASHSPEETAKAVGYSRRMLERRFKAATGLGLKTYARILRFRQSLKGDFTAQNALNLGYCDQSHLYRDFKRFCGMNPGEYAAIIQDKKPQSP